MPKQHGPPHPGQDHDMAEERDYYYTGDDTQVKARVCRGDTCNHAIMVHQGRTKTTQKSKLRRVNPPSKTWHRQGKEK